MAVLYFLLRTLRTVYCAVATVSANQAVSGMPVHTSLHITQLVKKFPTFYGK